MKRFLILTAFLFPVLVFSQNRRTTYFQPNGAGVTYTPSSTITGSTAIAGVMQSLFKDTVKANQLGAGKSYDLDAYLDVVTGISLLPTLTIRFYFGTDSLTITNAAVLGVSQVNGPLHIRIKVTNTIDNFQFCYAELLGTNGVLLAGAAVYPTQKYFTQIMNTDKYISLSAMLSSAVNITTVQLRLNNVVRMPI